MIVMTQNFILYYTFIRFKDNLTIGIVDAWKQGSDYSVDCSLVTEIHMCRRCILFSVDIIEDNVGPSECGVG